MVTNEELNDRCEPGCFGVLADKKYFHVGDVFIKRTLRRHEWQSVQDILMVPPASHPQRWKNDAAIVRYLREKTDIPLPRLLGTWEDDGAFHFCTEWVEGVSMAELSDEDQEVVKKEVEQHVATLRSLRSDTPGVPGDDLMFPPTRLSAGLWGVHSCWRPRGTSGSYVFCHNDLGQHNVIVDPETLRIKAIIDWESGGFWPEWFERPFWERAGPSVAIDGEKEDVERCREWVLRNCDEVVMKHL